MGETVFVCWRQNNTVVRVYGVFRSRESALEVLQRKTKSTEIRRMIQTARESAGPKWAMSTTEGVYHVDEFTLL